MTLLAIGGLLLVIGVLIGLAILSQSEVVPWVDDMEHAKVGKTYEWLAPPEIQIKVKEDYLAAINFTRDALSQSWIVYARDLDNYATHPYLQDQRRRLEKRLHKGGARILDILEAHHQTYARHFSEDGLACILLDYQTQRYLKTYDYWSKRPLLRIALENCINVYRMRYDSESRRWKIAEFIQEIPAHRADIVFERDSKTLPLYLENAHGRDDTFKLS